MFSLNSGVSCCKNCSDRYIGCHSSCEKYIHQNKEKDMFKEKIRKVKEFESLLYRGRRYGQY